MYLTSLPYSMPETGVYVKVLPQAPYLAFTEDRLHCLLLHDFQACH